MNWEYKYTYIDVKMSDKKTNLLINEELNRLGDEGWELVNFAMVLMDSRYAFVFKREKKE